MRKRRKSGILMSISSIPSPYGIGTFSREAYEFVDFLRGAGQSLWQILPLGPTGYGDSPYQSFSTFAGNPYLIDLRDLVERGYLTQEECESRNWGGHEEYVDYGCLYERRGDLHKLAYERARKAGLEQEDHYLDWKESQKDWLGDFTLYAALKEESKGAGWLEWKEDVRLRRPEGLEAARKRLADRIGFFTFQQYLFSIQWQALKAYANSKGIEIVGDIPIYVALDSADCWSHPELFQLDENRIPTGVAGCPPDAFSATGQLWGNPLYDWDYHKATGYEWWMNRIAYCYEIYDVLRIDHFRGFDEYWAIPYGDTTAQGGQWLKGPGIDMFRVMKQKLGNKKVIAEDLGFLTDTVLKLVKKTGFPGMKVLQFAFDPAGKSPYLPHNYDSNCVVYTGTHDNDTNVGWWNSLSRKEKAFVKKYLNLKNGKDISWVMIRAALSSVADTAIIPMQDYLELGGEARMNMPSSMGSNWKWRMKKGLDLDELASRILEMNQTYDRA